MSATGATKELEEFATTYGDSDLTIHRASVAIDERQDGEPVTRVLLLMSEPAGETWDVERVRNLRHALGRKATELDLPAVSLTLVPESEAEYVEPFSK